MVDGDELCLTLGESGCRVNVDSALADGFSRRLRRHEQKILEKSLDNEAMNGDKRLTSQLIGVFDVGSFGL